MLQLLSSATRGGYELVQEPRGHPALLKLAVEVLF